MYVCLVSHSSGTFYTYLNPTSRNPNNMVLGHDPSYQLEYGIILVLDKYTPCTKVLSDGMYRPEIPPKSIIFPQFLCFTTLRLSVHVRSNGLGSNLSRSPRITYVPYYIPPSRSKPSSLPTNTNLSLTAHLSRKSRTRSLEL